MRINKKILFAFGVPVLLLLLPIKALPVERKDTGTKAAVETKAGRTGTKPGRAPAKPGKASVGAGKTTTKAAVGGKAGHPGIPKGRASIKSGKGAAAGTVKGSARRTTAGTIGGKVGRRGAGSGGARIKTGKAPARMNRATAGHGKAVRNAIGSDKRVVQGHAQGPSIPADRIGTRVGQAGTLDYQHSLERFRKAAGRTGIMLVALPSGEVVFEHQSKTSLVPASLVKLLTSYAALKSLGPSFRFGTEAFAAKAPVGGVIDGDLWIKGFGDPFFVPEKVPLLVNAIKERGVSRIIGGIYADNSFFEPASERICIDSDCIGSYNPVVSATSFDFNMFTLRLIVPPKPGQAVAVDTTSARGYVKVSGNAVSSSKGNKPLLVRSLGIGPDGREDFQISGQAPAKGPRIREYRFQASDPAGLFAHTVRSALERSGIQILGKTTGAGVAPRKAVMIARYESPPVSELIAGINKHSNNFMAEMLLKAMAGHLAGAPGSTRKGVDLVQAALDQARIPTDTGMLDCGSGLSRFCLVSPNTFCRLLIAAWEDPLIGADFLSSLAVNSGDGTLRRRMRKPGLTVRGKTGTLNDVIAFAGYVSGPSGRTFAVCIMLNDVHDRGMARNAIDMFLEEVALAPRN